MIWFIISIILTIGVFVALGLEKESPDDYHVVLRFKLRKRQLCALFCLLIMVFGCIGWLPANHVGIVYSPFGGTKDYTLNEGLYIKSPFDKVYKMSTETQTAQIENVTTQTKDAQYVTSVLYVQYSVDASNAYKVFKQYRTLKNLHNTLIAPTTQRVLELITTKYNVIDIHYAYVGPNESVQKSEKDITIVVPKVGSSNSESNALANSIITAINTATGLSIAKLSVV